MRKMICLLVSLIIGFSAIAIEPTYIPSLGGEGTGSENSAFQNSYINSFGSTLGNSIFISDYYSTSTPTFWGHYTPNVIDEATISSDKQLEAGERRIAEREKIIAEVQKHKHNKVVNKYFSKLQKYQNKWFEIQDNETLSPEEKRTKGEKIISMIAKEIPGASRKNAIYFSKADLSLAIYKAEEAAK